MNEPVKRELPLRLRECAVEEMDDLSLTLAQYHILYERMLGFGGMEGLLPLLDLMIVWHDGMLDELPACATAIELAILMSQGIADYSSMIGLIYAEQTVESNPYTDTFFEKTLEIESLARSADLFSDSRPALWNYGGQLFACSVEEAATLGGIIGEYQALIEAARETQTLEDLLEFSNDQIKWRESSWQSLPDCGEALEVGLFIYRSAGDYFPLYVLETSQDALGKQLSGDLSLRERLAEIVASEIRKPLLRAKLPQDMGRPRCSNEDSEAILATLADYQDLLDIASTITRWGGLRSYIDTRLDLRERTSTEIPNCHIGLDLFSILTSNLAGAIANAVPGVGSAVSANAILLEQLSELASDLERESEAAVKPRPYANNLPVCSDEELDAIVNFGPSYLGLLQTIATELETADGMFAYLDQPLNWHGSAISHFRLCAEFFEIGQLIHVVGSDLLAAAALGFAGMSPIEHGFPVEPADLNLLKTRIDEANELLQSGERAQISSPPEGHLPTCSNAQLADLRSELKDNQVIARMAIQSESISDLLAYIQPHRQWRRDVWSRLPVCRESYEVGIRMTEMGDNLLSYMVFDHRGSSVRDTQFSLYMADDSYRMFNWLTLLDKGDRAAIDAFLASPYTAGQR